MNKLYSIICIAGIMLSCNVRDKEKKSLNTLVEQDSLSTTTVRMIDSVYDFGTITEGESVEFSFRFENTGKYPLIVSNVSASCGCTVPERPKEPILPGQSGFIKAAFNSDRRPGESSKSITVVSNASPGFPPLVLKGMVDPKPSN